VSARATGVSVVALVLSIGFAPRPAAARELWRHGDLSIALTGSVRELLVATTATDREAFEEAFRLNAGTCVPAASFPNCPAFDVVGDKDTWLSLTRLRTRIDGTLTSALSFTVAYDHELLLGIIDTFETELRRSFGSDTYWDLDHTIDEGSHSHWEHSLYRAFVELETDRIDARIGRQRISWGVGRLWSPMDRFSEIPPLAIERDQFPGVDAIDVRWNLSGFDFLQVVYAPGDDTSRDGSEALRFHGVVREVDVSLMAGIFEQARVAGFDLARNVGDAALRLEVVYTNPERQVWPVGKPTSSELSSFVQAIVSMDYNVDVGAGLYLLVEHLYNGNALGFGRGQAGRALAFFESTGNPANPIVTPASSDVLGSSLVVSAAIHLTGFQAVYELTPALQGSLLAIIDWNGESAAYAPSLSYTGLDAIELTLGVQLFSGPRLSEYGDLDPIGFLYVEYFF
jgi:hypothetical protein